MSNYERELQMVEEASRKGPLGKAAIYTKLSGPGWMQGAITLGGGSLAGALYLGVIAGFGLMWLQPLAMICGIIMLAAIAYVTLSTEQRPFGAINQHLSPLLGWSWLIATIMANIVWCMPQFGLGTAAIQQNLFPSIGSGTGTTIAICAVMFFIAFGINLLYESDGKGVKVFDWIIKILVGLIVLSFFAVVITLTTNGAINWGQIFAGLIPDPSLLFKPSSSFDALIAASSNPDWWTAHIIKDQRDIIVTAFATAVGINMTWLLPYSLLKKRWGKKHRGLAIFDLSIGLFIPFFLATSCVVIAAASQFHAKTDDVEPGSGAKTIAALEASYAKTPESAVPANDSDQRLADMLVKRNNFQLATTLEPLAGKTVSQKIFGFGVLGMAISTIIILMLMNGLAFQELFGKPNNKTVHLFGCAVSGIAGTFGPFLWTGPAKAALAIPTSVIGGSLIPIAYFTFFLMMNSKKVLGENLPSGGKRVLWNTLMATATGIATLGSFWVLHGKTSLPGWQGAVAWGGLGFLVLLFVVGTVSFLKNEQKPA
ncbi:divalent metal cation transporter [Haloferula rosea]|uniref:Divalent metal cation transporter n=1 Tax=Haloferula rosea TaxID=490093 RepID=A0A934VF58_9BACT|nr:divalent metal cation transporter [Haloferula rosea]MBK1828019.1 divalent metal cation transporter [Haloferula rosea]